MMKVLSEIKSVPQRLKPRYERSTCGTAEAVPLSKTDFQHFFQPLILFRNITWGVAQAGTERAFGPLQAQRIYDSPRQ
jgi:hypothetical protein